MEALPTKEGGQVGVLLFRPDDERILGLKDAADGRALFEVCVCAYVSSTATPFVLPSLPLVFRSPQR